MKTITVNVSEPVYSDFREFARRQDRPTSELIREAMALYRDQRIRPRGSLRDLPALALGEVLQPVSSDDDVLDEMLNG